MNIDQIFAMIALLSFAAFSSHGMKCIIMPDVYGGQSSEFNESTDLQSSKNVFSAYLGLHQKLYSTKFIKWHSITICNLIEKLIAWICKLHHIRFNTVPISANTICPIQRNEPKEIYVIRKSRSNMELHCLKYREEYVENVLLSHYPEHFIDMSHPCKNNKIYVHVGAFTFPEDECSIWMPLDSAEDKCCGCPHETSKTTTNGEVTLSSVFNYSKCLCPENTLRTNVARNSLMNRIQKDVGEVTTEKPTNHFTDHNAHLRKGDLIDCCWLSNLNVTSRKDKLNGIFSNSLLPVNSNVGNLWQPLSASSYYDWYQNNRSIICWLVTMMLGIAVCIEFYVLNKIYVKITLIKRELVKRNVLNLQKKQNQLMKTLTKLLVEDAQQLDEKALCCQPFVDLILEIKQLNRDNTDISQQLKETQQYNNNIINKKRLAIIEEIQICEERGKNIAEKVEEAANKAKGLLSSFLRHAHASNQAARNGKENLQRMDTVSTNVERPES